MAHISEQSVRIRVITKADDASDRVTVAPQSTLRDLRKMLDLDWRSRGQRFPPCAGREDVCLFAVRHFTHTSFSTFSQIGLDRSRRLDDEEEDDDDYDYDELKAGRSLVLKNSALRQVNGRPFGRCTARKSPGVLVKCDE